jgi:hypothetical protein
VSLLGTILDGPSWHAWRTLIFAVMGEDLEDDEWDTFTALTGRERGPLERVEEFWCVIGRRGGKSRVSAALAIYLCACCDYRNCLSIGERGVCLVLAQNSKQAGVAGTDPPFAPSKLASDPINPSFARAWKEGKFREGIFNHNGFDGPHNAHGMSTTGGMSPSGGPWIIGPDGKRYPTNKDGAIDYGRTSWRGLDENAARLIASNFGGDTVHHHYDNSDNSTTHNHNQKYNVSITGVESAHEVADAVGSTLDKAFSRSQARQKFNQGAIA